MDKVQDYIIEKKELRNNLIYYIDNGGDCNLEKLIDIFEKQKYRGNRSEIKQVLYLMSIISIDHYKCQDFWNRMEQILLYFKSDITNLFSNEEILNIFKMANKHILLFLLNEKLLFIDDISLQSIYEYPRYFYYFFPEIQQFLSENQQNEMKKNMININENIFDDFEKKRQLAANDSYICTLIRDDKVKEFVFYVNHANIPLSSSVPDSIFETSQFLLAKKVKLIDYAAFYGAIKIFLYLLGHGVNISYITWNCAILSNNFKLIKMLLDDVYFAQDVLYDQLLEIAIQAHHDKVADFFLNNYADSSGNKFIENALQYHNYAYFPDDFDNLINFMFLCKHDYFYLVKVLFETKKFDLYQDPIFDFYLLMGHIIFHNFFFLCNSYCSCGFKRANRYY